MAGCYWGYTVLGFAPAPAGAPIPMSRLIHRGPGLRRDEKENAEADVMLNAVLALRKMVVLVCLLVAKVFALKALLHYAME